MLKGEKDMNKIKFKDLPTYVVKTEFGDYRVKVVSDNYLNKGALAVLLLEEESGEEFAVLTVNIDGVAENNFSYVDTNNNKWAVEFIEENKLGVDTGGVGFSGYCVYPLFKFDETKLTKYENVDFGGDRNGN